MMNRKWFFWVVFALLFRVGPAPAHEGHKKQPQKETQTMPESEKQLSPNPGPVTPPAEVTIEEEKLPPYSELIISHLHNKIVHFPFALGLAGALFVFLGRRNPHFENAAKILWAISALMAIAAYFTGKLQEEPFEEGFLHPILELHQTLGISTIASLWIGFAMLLLPSWRRYAAFWAILVVLLISATGFYGGVLAHS